MERNLSVRCTCTSIPRTFFGQVANNVASLGCVAININSKNRRARFIHADRGAENFRLLHPGIGDAFLNSYHRLNCGMIVVEQARRQGQSQRGDMNAKPAMSLPKRRNMEFDINESEF